MAVSYSSSRVSNAGFQPLHFIYSILPFIYSPLSLFSHPPKPLVDSSCLSFYQSSLFFFFFFNVSLIFILIISFIFFIITIFYFAYLMFSFLSLHFFYLLSFSACLFFLGFLFFIFFASVFVFCFNIFFFFSSCFSSSSQSGSLAKRAPGHFPTEGLHLEYRD